METIDFVYKAAKLQLKDLFSKKNRNTFLKSFFLTTGFFVLIILRPSRIVRALEERPEFNIEAKRSWFQYFKSSGFLPSFFGAAMGFSIVTLFLLLQSQQNELVKNEVLIESLRQSIASCEESNKLLHALKITFNGRSF
jgi:hypothetical protein